MWESTKNGIKMKKLMTDIKEYLVHPVGTALTIGLAHIIGLIMALPFIVIALSILICVLSLSVECVTGFSLINDLIKPFFEQYQRQ